MSSRRNGRREEKKSKMQRLSRKITKELAKPVEAGFYERRREWDVSFSVPDQIIALHGPRVPSEESLVKAIPQAFNEAEVESSSQENALVYVHVKL